MDSIVVESVSKIYLLACRADYPALTLKDKLLPAAQFLPCLTLK